MKSTEAWHKLLRSELVHKVLFTVICMKAKEGEPEKRNSVDPFGLGMGGHLSSEGRAHRL